MIILIFLRRFFSLCHRSIPFLRDSTEQHRQRENVTKAKNDRIEEKYIWKQRKNCVCIAIEEIQMEKQWHKEIKKKTNNLVKDLVLRELVNYTSSITIGLYVRVRLFLSDVPTFPSCSLILSASSYILQQNCRSYTHRKDSEPVI